jgi:hypothetical protein
MVAAAEKGELVDEALGFAAVRSKGYVLSNGSVRFWRENDWSFTVLISHGQAEIAIARRTVSIVIGILAIVCTDCGKMSKPLIAKPYLSSRPVIQLLTMDVTSKLHPAGGQPSKLYRRLSDPVLIRGFGLYPSSNHRPEVLTRPYTFRLVHRSLSP